MKRNTRKIFTLLLAACAALGMGFSTHPASNVPSKALPIKDSAAPGNVLNAVIVSANEVYCYEKELDSGRSYSMGAQNSFHSCLLGMKKVYGEKLKVNIKPTAGAEYRATIDVLNEMTNCKIDRFEILDLNEAEQKKFGPGKKEDLTWPSIGYVPPKMDRESLKERTALVIDMKENGKAELVYLDRDSLATQLPPVSNATQLKAAIDKAIGKAGGKDRLQAQFKAPADLKYADFRWVIQALHTKGIYHYQLITTSE